MKDVIHPLPSINDFTHPFLSIFSETYSFLELYFIAYIVVNLTKHGSQIDCTGQLIRKYKSMKLGSYDNGNFKGLAALKDYLVDASCTIYN